ncbi:MAG: hypothetical protein AAFY08_11530 [Planctomycetota bacterium]
MPTASKLDPDAMVLSIIVIASAITFPFIGAMTRDLSATSGVNTVQAATMAARAYATRDKSARPLDANAAPPIEAEYSGSAALFTPDNLIRIVENAGNGAEDARYLTNSAGDFLESAYKASNGVELNGFVDVLGREPIQLDPNTGVVGIIRAPDDAAHNTLYRVRLSGETTRLIPPPFAVWFSPSGSIVAGIPLLDGTNDEIDRSRNRVVYYDGNHTRDLGNTDHIDVRRTGPGAWTSSNRDNPDAGSPYDANQFDPASGQYDRATAFNEDLNRAVLPFEEIEAVVGVIVYDKADFRGAGFDWPAISNAEGQDMAEWLTENGTAVFFSPTSGVAFREARQQ